MSTKVKVRNGGDRASQQRRTRNRQQERTWKRGKQRGCIDSALAEQLALLAVVFLLFVGGVAA